MVGSGTAATFMRAEAEATSLVQELTRLKAEAESYQQASSTLREAGVGVARLATELAGAVQRLDGVIRTLQAIGTPEILAAQEAMETEVATLRTELAETRQSLAASAASQQEALNASARKLQKTLDTLLSGSGLLLVGLVVLGILIYFRTG